LQQRPPKFLSVLMMAKAGKDAIEMDGIVTDALPNAMFRVELEANKQVLHNLFVKGGPFLNVCISGNPGSYFWENSEELHQNIAW
jgi:hypothetical protein